MNALLHISHLRFFTLLIVLQIWCVSAALGQTGSRSERLAIRNEVKAEQLKRKGLKEAKGYDSAYKQTHLNTQTYGYKTGREGRRAMKKEAAANQQQKTWKVKRGIKHKMPLFKQAGE